ncbi:uncharacterized protein LOC143898090 [Temnothorax americanus]|uniref:uncharacterized protein LOC143898090 n=1 Tax=Temnothorax americanus TaxID=1964332 RepID=UPI004068C127
MIYIVTQHFSLNRIILLLIGLWPYQCSKLVQLQIILCFSILISSVVYQLAVFISADCTIDLILKVFSFALFFCMYVIEYNSFRINRQTMKWSLEQLQRICNELKDEKEIDIMKKCGDNSRRYTTLLMWLNVCNIIAIILFTLVLYIFDTVLRINEYHLTINRLIQMLIPKHFVGRENYMYIIILHSGSTIIIGGIILVATMTMCVAYIKHACGMFRIASYRIEKAIAVNTLENVSLENEIIMYREIIHAVDIHRKAIKATALFFSGFQRSRFVLLIIGVLTLSLNLYGVSEAISHDIHDLVFHFLIVIDIFVYVFVFNYAGQEFMDHNDHIFSTAYNVRWYVTPLHVQKLILFLLQRGSKTVSLNFGIMFVLSLELFAALTKASISYFTVICSM